MDASCRPLMPTALHDILEPTTPMLNGAFDTLSRTISSHFQNFDCLIYWNRRTVCLRKDTKRFSDTRLPEPSGLTQLRHNARHNPLNYYLVIVIVCLLFSYSFASALMAKQILLPPSRKPRTTGRQPTGSDRFGMRHGETSCTSKGTLDTRIVGNMHVMPPPLQTYILWVKERVRK